MIVTKNQREIELMREAGRVVALVHEKLKDYIKPGLTTKEIDTFCEKVIRDAGATPSFLNLYGFPGSVCTSINEVVVHGIPSNTVLKEGDIISVDVGACYKGYHGDSAWTYAVGQISEEAAHLMKVTEESLYAGIEKMCPGNVLDDISKAIEAVANREGYGIVRQYGGHGVGHEMHEDPFLFNYSVGNNTLIKQNIAIAIEPMLNLGCDDVIVEDDEWTVSTKDGKPSAHFEHTVIATDDGPLITTKLMK